MDRSRRDLFAAMGGALLAAPFANALASSDAKQDAAGGKKKAPGKPLLKVRLLLNSAISGPHAFFAIAQQRGYFADAGVEVEFAAGDGASSVVPRIPQEGFDGGYGDLNSLIKLVGQRPANAPIAVHVAFNTTPLTVGVRRSGSIRSPRDLEGKVIGGHPIDSALEMFPAYAMVAGFDHRKVQVVRSTTSMATIAEDAIAGHADGVFGFVHTIIAALAGKGIDGRKGLRFLEYRDFVPELYGNALMLSPDLIAKHPEEVRGLVVAVNRGVIDAFADPEAALAAVQALAPKFARHVDGPRMRGTLEVEMSNPEALRIGIGNVDDARLRKSIELMSRSCELPRAVRPEQVFTREFLPPVAQLAKPKRLDWSI